MNWRRALVCLVVLAPLSAAAQERQHLTVFAAASLREAFRELGDTMERRTPGLRVDFNFAGSQELAAQLLAGAAADVFASADGRWMKFARDSGIIAGEPRAFVRNRLVVIVPKTTSGGIGKLQDLARPGVKLVLASSVVPAGAYSRVMLNNLSRSPGFDADFGSRTINNVVSQEQDVRAVVSKVQLGEADAGVCYVSDVSPKVSRDVRVFEIPEAANVVAEYPIARVKNGANAAGALAFIDLVISPAGQATLARHHFAPLDAH